MNASSVRRPLVGTLLVGVVAVGSLLVSPTGTIAALESLAADPVAFGLVVVGLYLVRPLFALPTTPLAVFVGYGYGIALGVLVALAGVVVTAIPVFVTVRWLAGDGDGGRRGPFSVPAERACGVARAYYRTAGPIRGVTASRLAPIPADVATTAAAVSGVELRHLAIGTAIGEVPWTVAAVVVGASTARLTTDGLGEIGPPVAFGCVLAATLLLAGPAYRATRGRNPESG